jgi:hypothetical protein
MVLYETLSGQPIRPQNNDPRSVQMRQAPLSQQRSQAPMTFQQQYQSIFNDTSQLILWIITTIVFAYVVFKHFNKKNKKASYETFMY